MKKFDKNQKNPTFIVEDCFKVLKKMEANSIDAVITSPPYFREREKNKHFNLNQSIDSYIETILKMTSFIKTVLKEEGSFWLNLGDCYSSGSLQQLPSRIAIRMVREQGWILNNDIIWMKKSSTPTSFGKRLSNSYEHFYHFVKNKEFYYNISALDAKKNSPKVVGSVIKSSSNVTGKNYHRIINESRVLNDEQKQNALKALNGALNEIKEGTISDFRMIIAGHNKLYSSNRLDELN